MLEYNYIPMKTLESYYKRNTETPHICTENNSNSDKKKEGGY